MEKIKSINIYKVISKKDDIYKDKEFYTVDSNSIPFNSIRLNGNFTLLNIKDKNDLVPIYNGKLKIIRKENYKFNSKEENNNF
jgi:hypothetical protein